MKKAVVIFLFFFKISLSQTKIYRIDISDGTNNLYTMNQFNNLIQNGYRIGFGQIDYKKLQKRKN